MPPAVAAAAITGAAALGGGVLASRANNRATDAQERAAREAMNYQREQERAAAEAERRAYAEYRPMWDQWYADTYGASTPRGHLENAAGETVSGDHVFAPNPTAPGAGPGGVPPTPGAVPGAQPRGMPTGAAPTADTFGASSAPPMMQPRTLADIGGWSQHNRYFPGRV